MRSDILPAGARTINWRIIADLQDFIPGIRGFGLFACVVDWQKPTGSVEVKGERGTRLLKCPIPVYQDECYVILPHHIAPMLPDMRLIASW